MTNGSTSDTSTNAADGGGSVAQNKAASRRWIEVFNERDDAAEAEIRGPDYIAHAPASLEPTPLDSDAWTKFLAGFVNGFPDLRLTVEARSAKAIWSPNGCSSKAPIQASSRGFHRRIERSRSPG